MVCGYLSYIVVLIVILMDENTDNFKVFEDKRYVVICVNPKLYSLSVVKRAAYFFTGKYDVNVYGDGSKIVKVKIALRDGMKDDLLQIGKNFLNELVRTSVEYEQAEKYRGLREAIFREAMNMDAFCARKRT